MGRLFDKEDRVNEIEPGQLTRNGVPVDMFSLQEAESSVELVTESFKNIQHQYDLIKHIEQSYNSNNHLLAVEAYNPLLKSLAANLGVKTAIPSLEDYKNEYTAKASKEIAVEGINDFIKKVWESIRKFFVDFFKKISEFARRLVNANLQIDTYERYVPDLLKKINNDKLKCSDPKKVVDTKLVKLLAPEGVDKLDSIWIVNNIRTIVGYTVDRIDYLISNALPSIVKDDLNVISDIFQNKYPQLKNMNSIDEVNSTIDDINTVINGCIDSIVNKLCPTSVHVGDLPDDVYDRLADLTIDVNTSELNVRAFTDVKSNLDRLPGNFNLFIAVDNANKLYSVGSSEPDNDKSNVIEVISEFRQLEAVFEQYKVLTKGFNVSKMHNVFSAVEKQTSNFIKVIPNQIDKLRKEFTSKPSNGGSNMFTTRMLDDDEYLPIRHDYKCIIIGLRNKGIRYGYNEEIYDYEDYNPEFLPEIYSYLPEFKRLIEETNNPHDIASNYENLVTALFSFREPGSSNSEFHSETNKLVIGSLNDNEKKVINFIQNLQIALRNVQTTYPSLVTDLRYETLKYVYDSAKTFG